MFGLFKKKNSLTERQKKLILFSAYLVNEEQEKKRIDAPAFYELALQFFNEKMFVPAIKHMEKAIQGYEQVLMCSAREIGGAYHVIAKSYVNLQEYDLAISAYQKEIEAYFELLEFQKKSEPLSEGDISAGVLISNSCCEIVGTLLPILSMEPNPEKMEVAKKYALMAVEYNPASGQAHQGLGFVYLSMFNPFEAKKSFQKAYDLNFMKPEYYSSSLKACQELEHMLVKTANVWVPACEEIAKRH